MVKAIMPNLLFFGTYEARVVTAAPPAAVQSQLGGVTWVVSAVFTDPAIVKLLPPLANLTMWPGPVWGFSAPAPGSLVRVQFVNGDPSKPAIVGLDPATPPTSVSIGGPLAATKPLVLSAQLALALSAAGSAAASAASPGDGGKAAFAAFVSSMVLPTNVLLYTTLITKAA